jgi:hypothetical protein
MIALSLIRVIERHSNELAVELVAKLGASPLTAEMRKVPVEELRRRIEEIFSHLTDWLLDKSGDDIEKRYLEIGERRASQGVALSAFCWAIAVTRDISGNSCSDRASSVDPLKFTARWNCCAFSTDFLIALCALRRKAMSTTPSCSINGAIGSLARDPANPIRQAVPPASLGFAAAAFVPNKPS